MTLNPNTPERYQHIDGRKVIAITELKIPNDGDTYIIHYKCDEYDFWGEKESFLIEIPQERWQGIEINEDGYIVSYSEYINFSISKVNQVNYTHAINLSTLEIVKL